MAQFQCRIMTDTGEIITESLHAENRAELLVSFRSRNYHPISVKEEQNSLADMQIGGKKIKRKSLILFCRQLSTLLHSGVPLIRCFDIISSQSDDKPFKKALTLISEDIQSGSLLSTAIEKQGDTFPPMLSRMAAVGEETGDLSKIMGRMAEQYESDERVRKKIKGAMMYPIVLVCIALAACVFMLTSIVPRFVEIFDALDTELPVLTRMLLSMSNFVTHRWYVLLFVIPALVCIGIRIFRTEKVIRWVDRKLLTLKLLRSPMQKLMSAEFARTLHTLIASGIPIVQALESTRQSIKNTVIKDAIQEISLGIQKGKGISVQMAQYPYFPNLLVSMVSIGEASGNLEDMLAKTASYYDEEMDSAISQLITVLEPVMIVIVGVLIGAMVMALYAPMFGAVAAMSGSV